MAGRGAFVPLGEAAADDDVDPFASLPGSATVHGRTTLAGQPCSVTVVSAPLNPGPSCGMLAPPSSTPEPTNFAPRHQPATTLTTDMNGGAFVPQSEPSSLSTEPPSQPAAESHPAVPTCPICDARFREPTALWKHLNQEHIARRIFPSAAFLAQHGRRLCGNPTCSYAYSARWQTCPRSLGAGQGRCGGTLLDPPVVIAARSVRPIPTRPPPEPPTRTAPPSPLTHDNPVSLPGFSTDPALAAVAAAACLRAQPTQDDGAAFASLMEEIALLPVGTVAHVPRATRPLLAEVLTICLRDARTAGLWGFARLMMFAKGILRSPPRGGRQKRHVVKASILSRLHRWQRGELVELWREVRTDARPREATGGAEAVARGNARRALRLAMVGRYSDAMQALGSHGCASPGDEEALQDMLRRHPHQDVPEWSDAPPAPLVVEPEFVLAALKGFPRGSSPGSSKLRAQHLVDAISGTTVPAAVTCLAELTWFTNYHLAGRGDRRIAPWLVGAPLTALIKQPTGFRPIAVGEVLRRLISWIGCAAVRCQLPSLFLPSGQVGVGVSGGLDAAIHALRVFLTDYGTDEGLCCLKVDMANAFNACSREALLHRTREHLPELYSWVQWCYTCVGELRFGSHRIGSSTGVQQGDPLGPILFSLVLLELTENLRQLDGIRLSLWYLDDGTVIGTRKAVRQLLDHLIVNGPRFGLHLNLSKCEIYWPSGDQAFPDFPVEITRIGEIQHGVELLGSPVFGDADFFCAAVGRRVSRVLAAQAHLEDLDHPQVALHLLQSCLSIRKINHLLRTVPPRAAATEWARFDTGLRLALGGITRTSVPDAAWLQATLPVRLGGLGLRETSTVHPAAFLGCCSAARDLVGFLMSSTTHSSISVEAAPSTAAPLRFPGEDTAREAFLSHLSTPPDLDLTSSRQGRLQAALDEAAHCKLRSAACLRDLARLTATSAHHAGAWLRALPAPALGLAMLPHEHVLALRLWLGITIFPLPPAALRCICGVQLDPFGDHLLGCGHGVLRIQRHDALRDIVYHALRMDNPGVRTEQRCQGDHLDRPGDIFHPDFQDGRPAYFDVTVRNTLQPAFLAEGAIRPGVAAEAGEAAKDLHHAAAVEQAGGVFLPLAVESFGVWTPHSLATLQRIAAHTTTASGLTAGRAQQNLLQQLSVRLWQFNARLLRSRLQVADDVVGWDLPG